MVIDNPKTLEILKRRCGVVYTVVEAEYIEKRDAKLKAHYAKLDPVLHSLYELRCIQRKRLWTPIEKHKHETLIRQRDKIIAEKNQTESEVQHVRERFPFEN